MVLVGLALVLLENLVLVVNLLPVQLEHHKLKGCFLWKCIRMASLRSNKSTCAMIALIALLSGISSTQIPLLNAQSHSNVTIDGFAFSPQDTNIAPSDVVTWNVMIDGFAFSPQDTNIAPSDVVTWNVMIDGFAFSPQDTNIAPSDVVTWKNNDPVIHTLWFVIAENQTTYLLSDPIAPEGSWSHTFYEPLRLQYYCLERLWITGNITVGWRAVALGGGRVPYAQ